MKNWSPNGGYKGHASWSEDDRQEIASADWKSRREENHRDYLISKGEDVIYEESEDEDE